MVASLSLDLRHIWMRLKTTNRLLNCWLCWPCCHEGGRGPVCDITRGCVFMHTPWTVEQAGDRLHTHLQLVNLGTLSKSCIIFSFEMPSFHSPLYFKQPPWNLFMEPLLSSLPPLLPRTLNSYISLWHQVNAEAIFSQQSSDTQMREERRLINTVHLNHRAAPHAASWLTGMLNGSKSAPASSPPWRDEISFVVNKSIFQVKVLDKMSHDLFYLPHRMRL